MKNYELDEDEVVLYKGKVDLKERKGNTELILTNKNIVLATEIKKIFSKEEVFVDIYSVGEVKDYEGKPQVLKKGNLIEIYLLHEEVEFSFDSGSECRKFMDAVLKLITHKNKFERGVDKVNSAIASVDKSLGVNSKEIAGNIVTSGGVGKTAKVIGGVAKAIGSIKKSKK